MVELLGDMVDLCLVFKGTSILFSIMAGSVYSHCNLICTSLVMSSVEHLSVFTSLTSFFFFFRIPCIRETM